MIKNIPYIGNGAYCYANSTSMLLSSINEDISPSLIEVLTGVGLSATLKQDGGFLYFNNQTSMPDLGISKTLNLLGFEARTEVFETKKENPFIQLEKDLETSPALLGPLDMFHLVYNPRHEYLKGADHFVLAYKIKGDNVYLHDPAGFPHVFINKEDLRKAWTAERISYKNGFYRYITEVKRKEEPSQQEIYNRAIKFFKSIYKMGEENINKDVWLVGKKAIGNTADRIRNNNLEKGELEHFIYFALPLGSKRALDFASFFDQVNSKLANLKRKQAEQFGFAHTNAQEHNLDSLAECLTILGELEKNFRDKLLELG
jgi:hypothetical protein